MSDITKKPVSQVSKVKAETKAILPPEPVPSLPPKSLPEGVTLPSPEEFRNAVLKEAGTARITKKEQKQKAERNLIEVKQFRSDTLQKLFSYLSPFNNQIANINQPLKVELQHLEGTLNCNPLFTITAPLVGDRGFNINVKTDRTVTYNFGFNPEGEKMQRQFEDLLTYCQKLLVEALSNS